MPEERRHPTTHLSNGLHGMIEESRVLIGGWGLDTAAGIIEESGVLEIACMFSVIRDPCRMQLV